MNEGTRRKKSQDKTEKDRVNVVCHCGWEQPAVRRRDAPDWCPDCAQPTEKIPR